MSLLNFMEQKANEKGITVCPKCGKPDIWFSLANKCLECSSPLPDKPKNQKLQYAIELLVQFTQQYDEYMPAEPKKVFVQLGNEIAHKIETSNTFDNSKLIQFQYLCINIPSLGGNKFGGAIDGKKMAINILETSSAPLTVGKSLTAIILSLQFIKGFEVANEYVIESSTPKPRQGDGKSPVVTNPKSNSGCLGSVLMLSFLLIIVFISISLI